MEKNTLIAVILCVIVISAGYFVQAIFFPVEETKVVKQEESSAPAPEEVASAAEESNEPVQIVTTPADSGSYQDVTVETDVLKAVLTTKGGAVKSVKLKGHAEKEGETLEMIYRKESQMNAFELYFGDINTGQGHSCRVQEGLGSYRRKRQPCSCGDQEDIYIQARRVYDRAGNRVHQPQWQGHQLQL